jgi:hypothetical protein
MHVHGGLIWLSLLVCAGACKAFIICLDFIKSFLSHLFIGLCSLFPGAPLLLYCCNGSNVVQSSKNLAASPVTSTFH